jgi:S-adenosylmethionine hydrolase
MSLPRTPLQGEDRTAQHASLITLLTDFGNEDHYVGTVKGVLLSINPNLRIVDLTHSVKPQNILQAAYLLWAAYRYFSPQTIFLSVVDPGVGTGRRLLAVESNNYIFLAPDNGLLDLVLFEEQEYQAWSVDVTKARSLGLIESSISNTFHGRDIFAPIAAARSIGLAFSRVGESIRLHVPSRPFVTPDNFSQKPRILHIDRFGNIITNLRGTRAEWEANRFQGLEIGSKVVKEWIAAYADAPNRTPCLILGSSGLIEVVINKSSAAEALEVTVDTQIRILKHA